MSADLDWQDESACRSHDPDVFFGKDGFVMTEKEIAVAKAICATCPVADQCLQYALGFEDRADFGVWSGTTPNERAKLRRSQRRVSARMSQLRAAEARRLVAMGAHAGEVAGALGLSNRHARRLMSKGAIAS